MSCVINSQFMNTPVSGHCVFYMDLERLALKLNNGQHDLRSAILFIHHITALLETLSLLKKKIHGLTEKNGDSVN